jgi:hypothetical protein
VAGLKRTNEASSASGLLFFWASNPFLKGKFKRKNPIGCFTSVRAYPQGISERSELIPSSQPYEKSKNPKACFASRRATHPGSAPLKRALQMCFWLSFRGDNPQPNLEP